ncbi:MAG: hypothetical protein EBZ48_11320 [Proteobacteria bacterium]|nr:hypothetical protein [Pseudomonadota bacterium]
MPININGSLQNGIQAQSQVLSAVQPRTAEVSHRCTAGQTGHRPGAHRPTPHLPKPPANDQGKMIQDLIGMVGALVNSMKEITTQLISALKPAQPPAQSIPAPIQPLLPDPSDPLSPGAPSNTEQPSVKDKIMSIISQLLDLLLNNGKIDSLSTAMPESIGKSGEAEKGDGEKKKGGLFQGLLGSVVDFGRKFFEKKGSDAIMNVFKGF